MCRIIEILGVLQSFIQQKPFTDAPQNRRTLSNWQKTHVTDFFNKLADFEHILRKTFGQMFLFIVDLVESFSLTRNKVL